jgi:ribosomal protein S18 acetylase RimI-like enzyme
MFQRLFDYLPMLSDCGCKPHSQGIGIRSFLLRQAQERNMSNEKKLSCGLIQEGDVDVVAGLYTRIFSPAYRANEYARERIGNDRKGVVVAREGEAPVGFIYFSLIEEDKRQVLYISNIGVLTENRRMGVATAMLEWLFRHACAFQYEFAFLLVNGGNQAAFDCYVRCGFEISDSRVLRNEWEYDPLLIRMERKNVLPSN